MTSRLVASLILLALVLVGCQDTAQEVDGDTLDTSTLGSSLPPATSLEQDDLSDLESKLKLSLEACAEDTPCQGEALDEFWAACMTASGFLTYLDSDGNYTIENGGRDQEMFAAADFCDNRMYSLLPPPTEPTEEYFSDYYDFLVELKECVEAQGYFVEEPPSREAFIEASLSQSDIWHPYEHASNWEDLEKVCPQDFSG